MMYQGLKPSIAFTALLLHVFICMPGHKLTSDCFLFCAICRTKVKCRVETIDGQWVEKIPAWIKWATQEWNEVLFNGVYWCPDQVCRSQQ